MRKIFEDDIAKEQNLKKLIKETISNNIAQNPSSHSQMNSQVSQAHFEQLWAQAEHNFFQCSNSIKNTSV
jgi:hypothetical protein